jgi:hypothetical protein
MIRAVATVDGRVVGTWTARNPPDGFGDEVADIERFMAAPPP